MEIKPCPFCGGRAKIKGAGRYWIACTKCNANTTIADNLLDAVKLWNRREPDEDKIFLTRFEWILAMLGAAAAWAVGLFVWR